MPAAASASRLGVLAVASPYMERVVPRSSAMIQRMFGLPVCDQLTDDEKIRAKIYAFTRVFGTLLRKC